MVRTGLRGTIAIRVKGVIGAILIQVDIDTCVIGRSDNKNHIGIGDSSARWIAWGVANDHLGTQLGPGDKRMAPIPIIRRGCSARGGIYGDHAPKGGRRRHVRALGDDSKVSPLGRG